MTIWVDAQLSPAIAVWISTSLSEPAIAVRDLGLRDASDHVIFMAARQEGVIVISKDSDFVHLLDRYGPPPHVIWLTCGNTSNANLRRILAATLPQALTLIRSGERMVEIGGI